MKQGLIHIYTGDGKGKTTASLGLLLRAHGRGMRVVLAQFLKGRDTGELRVLETLEIPVLRQTRDLGFFGSASEENRAELLRQNNESLRKAIALAETGQCDLLVLDEICAAYALGAVNADLADRLVLQKPTAMELVLTGRNPPTHWLAVADYVTELMCRKHPYERGIAAREGIEF